MLEGIGKIGQAIMKASGKVGKAVASTVGKVKNEISIHGQAFRKTMKMNPEYGNIEKTVANIISSKDQTQIAERVKFHHNKGQVQEIIRNVKEVPNRISQLWAYNRTGASRNQDVLHGQIERQRGLKEVLQKYKIDDSPFVYHEAGHAIIAPRTESVDWKGVNRYFDFGINRYHNETEAWHAASEISKLERGRGFTRKESIAANIALRTYYVKELPNIHSDNLSVARMENISKPVKPPPTDPIDMLNAHRNKRAF